MSSVYYESLQNNPLTVINKSHHHVSDHLSAIDVGVVVALQCAAVGCSRLQEHQCSGLQEHYLCMRLLFTNSNFRDKCEFWGQM